MVRWAGTVGCRDTLKLSKKIPFLGVNPSHGGPYRNRKIWKTGKTMWGGNWKFSHQQQKRSKVCQNLPKSGDFEGHELVCVHNVTALLRKKMAVRSIRCSVRTELTREDLLLSISAGLLRLITLIKFHIYTIDLKKNRKSHGGFWWGSIRLPEEPRGSSSS